MKKLLGIVVLGVLAVFASAFRSPEPVPHYSFKVRPTAKGVRLECITGCKWINISATCETEPCEFLIDESGIVGTKDDRMRPFTELIPPDIVVIFKSDASNQQINLFLETVISQPDSRGGHAHRPGVGGIRSTRVGGYQGYVISWARSGTAADRKEVRGRIDRDPIVCKVFENVEPSAISPSDVACLGGAIAR